jgi:DNA-binding transcriptional regulator YdaS (Cro superfamily)
MRRRLNRGAKVGFFKNRQRIGDQKRLADVTGYSESHISNVLNYRRRIPQSLANAMYRMTYRRLKNEELAY